MWHSYPPVVRGFAPPTGGYDSSDRKRSFLSDSSDHSDSSDRSDHSEPLCPPPPLYISLRGNSSDSRLLRISTWGFRNRHVDVFYFPRGGESFLPKFHLILPKFHFIPPKNFLFPTWGFRNLHVGITFPRHGSVSMCSRL